MPLLLPSGVTLYNVTPHDLTLWYDYGDKGGGLFTALSDGVVNVKSNRKTVYYGKGYKLSSVTFLPTEEGDRVLKEIEDKVRENGENAVIVGSVLAAQAYPEKVVSTIPVKGKERRKLSGQPRLVMAQRFNTFNTQEIHNG